MDPSDGENGAFPYLSPTKKWTSSDVMGIALKPVIWSLSLYIKGHQAENAQLSQELPLGSVLMVDAVYSCCHLPVHLLAYLDLPFVCPPVHSSGPGPALHLLLQLNSGPAAWPRQPLRSPTRSPTQSLTSPNIWLVSTTGFICISIWFLVSETWTLMQPLNTLQPSFSNIDSG